MIELDTIISPYESLLRKAHQFQGNSNDCGPFCAAIALSALNRKADGYSLGKDLNKIQWKRGFPKIRRIPNWATFPWGLVDLFTRNGLFARWRPFNTQARLLKNLENDMINIVIIGGLIPLWAHTMILVAHNADTKWGFVNPANPSGDTYWIENNDFIYKWTVMGRLIVEIVPNLSSNLLNKW
jgi:hypothetical protein